MMLFLCADQVLGIYYTIFEMYLKNGFAKEITLKMCAKQQHFFESLEESRGFDL